MQFIVWTKQPTVFLQNVQRWMRQRGESEAEIEQLPTGQEDGECIRFDALSSMQFCTLEDTAAHMGLRYDGSLRHIPSTDSSRT